MSKYAIETPSREEFYKQIKKQRERERRKRKLRGVNWFFIFGIVLMIVGVYVYFETNFMLHDLIGVLIGAFGFGIVLGRFIPGQPPTEEDWEEYYRKREYEETYSPVYDFLPDNVFYSSFDD